MKDYFEKLLQLFLVRTTKTLVKKAIKKIEKKTSEQAETEETIKPHPMKVPVSNENPDSFTIRQEYCALNPKRNRKIIADYIKSDEIDYIAEKYFGSLTGAPKADNLGFEGLNTGIMYSNQLCPLT